MTNASERPSEDSKRYMVLLDKDNVDGGIQAVCQIAQLAQLEEDVSVISSADAESGYPHSDLFFLEQLGVAIVNHPLADQIGKQLMSSAQDKDTPIRAVVADENWAASEETNPLKVKSEMMNTVSKQYLEGYRDGINHLIESIKVPTDTEVSALMDSSATWGLQATRVLESPFSGAGIRIAVLDTGIDLDHPDFVGRTIVSRSFIPDVSSAQDGNGHGTHCIGIACGPRIPSILPRYGVAYESEIYVGKVLNDNGSGSSVDVLIGIEWAIEQGCPIISLSLGGEVRHGQTFDSFYEEVGDRALDEGSLLIAAAGDSSRRPYQIHPISTPANCPSFMAVAALNSNLQVAQFSNAGIYPGGGEVDLGGPGVQVYSSAPDPAVRGWPARYNTIDGTSMATPHVAGIAALYAQSTRRRGQALWNLLIRNARRLDLSGRDIGSGLVQAPTS